MLNDCLRVVESQIRLPDWICTNSNRLWHRHRGKCSIVGIRLTSTTVEYSKIELFFLEFWTLNPYVLKDGRCKGTRKLLLNLNDSCSQISHSSVILSHMNTWSIQHGYCMTVSYEKGYRAEEIIESYFSCDVKGSMPGPYQQWGAGMSHTGVAPEGG